MSERSARREGPAAVRYRIIVRGEIEASFVGPLTGLVVESAGDESTLLIDIVDQSHLQGVIRSLADRGIEIVSLGVDSGAARRSAGRTAGLEGSEGWPI